MNKYFILSVFATLFIFSSSPAYAENIIQWNEAANHIEEYLTVEGIVVAIDIGPGAPCCLCFDKNYKKHFTAIIPRADFHHFPKSPPVGLYIKKKVRVTGLIRQEEGRPVMTVTNPLQIEVVK